MRPSQLIARWARLSQISNRRRLFTSRDFSSGQSSRSNVHAITADQTIFSLIQPTGVPHIGNWLGALQQWVKFQKSEGQLLFGIADLHAITVPQSAAHLRQWRQEALATLLAVGLDPKRCTLFYQSAVPSHAELMWVLSCTSSLGYLSRMTTWKSKASLPNAATSLDSAAKAKAKLGLLAYPVLQAADILVHRASFVPVGADQAQHLEFARECARNFNAAHGQQILREPQVILSAAARVMSLRDPAQKMSKSHPDPRSRILLTDSHETIHQKIKASITDSINGDITYDIDRRPGVANLLNLLSYMHETSLGPAEHADQLKGQSLRAMKELVADEISAKLSPIRHAYFELVGSERGRKRLVEVAEQGAVFARKHAGETMRDVYSAIGML